MPKPRKYDLIPGRYFHWRLLRRNGVYYADGRSNRPNIGKHTLETRDRDEALKALHQLDTVKAVEHGLAHESALRTLGAKLLSLAEGRRLYEAYLGRSFTLGGPRPGTVKRYRPVLDKFLAFAVAEKVEHWNEVTKDLLTRYCAWLDNEDYAPRTVDLEVTTLKQIVRWMVNEKHLPAEAIINLPVTKVRGTSTHCYSEAEIAAMIEHCQQQQLDWLRSLIVCLATTGLRIGEVAQLRWSDVDLKNEFLRVRHEEGRKAEQGEGRTTKGRRPRLVPLHGEFIAVLKSLSHHADGRLFHGRDGGRLKADRVRYALRRDVLKPLASRFPGEGESKGILAGTLRSFRHSYTSSAAESGLISELGISSLLGHRESSKVTKTYFHARIAPLTKAVKRIAFLGEEAIAETNAPGVGAAPGAAEQ